MTAPPTTVRVLLAVHHASVRSGLESILAANPQIEVVATADTLAAAVAEVARECPDVVIVGDRLDTTGGVQACRAIRDVCPTARALLLVSIGGATALTATALAGAAGYVVRDLNTTIIQDAVIEVGHGRALHDPARASDLLARLHRIATDGRRDRDLWCSIRFSNGLLDCIAEGLPDHEIAERLDIPVETVRDAIRSLVAALPALRR